MTWRFDDRPWLILCEGESDKRFFDRLISARNIPNEFQVKFPDRGNDGSGGRSKFGSWLNLMMTTSEDFAQNIRGVLVISDNDDAPTDSFQAVKSALGESGGFPIPENEWEPAGKPGFPTVVVRMIPHDSAGNLETLCLEAAYNKWPNIQAPLDTYTGSVDAVDWHVGKQSKMRLQTVIASTCEPRPDAGFMGHWWEADDYHLPLNHDAFEQIEDDLRGFPALVASA